LEQGKEETKMNNKYLVTKANTLIRSHFKLNLEEQKIIATLVSLIQPQDEDFKPYEFKVSEFMKLLDVQDKSMYTRIPIITKGLMKKVFEIQDGDTLLQISWICSAKYNKGTGVVTLKFTPDLKPYLLGLKELFTPYRLENILSLTGQYSIRLYELLKSYEFKGVWEVTFSELSKILKLTKSYLDSYDMKKRILEPAEKEINEKTDITFSYETITERKKVVALKFHIQANPKNKLKKTLSESPERQELPALPDTTSSSQTDIGDIKAEFRQLYGGELMDKFVRQMIAEKGLEHIWECLRTYKDYISKRNISNIAGDFFIFVIKGYQKPTPYKGNVPHRDNFAQREYDDEELEEIIRSKWEKYDSDKSESSNSRITEVGESNLKSIKQILTPG
jgi:plasmid replication initiation protein